MKALLTNGFGAEAHRISAGGAGRFGTYEFTRPWTITPHADATNRTMYLARQLLWQAAAEAAHDGGRMITIAAPRPIAEIIKACLKDSLDPIGPRLMVDIAPVHKVIVS
jgi:hypothetical protein